MESTQQLLVKGKCKDIYYVNPETTFKECIRTKTSTKYSQALTQLAGGTSVFLVPPNYGLQDVVVQLQLPAVPAGAGANIALAPGWGYALIKSISYRIAGSTQFFVTGQQMLQYALKACPNATARNDLFTLGGAYVTGAGFEASTNFAYVWLGLPFAKPTSEAKPSPLPTDLINSQVQITIELNPLSAILSNNSGGALNAAFNSLASGQFTVQQVLMESRDDSLAAHESLATLEYPYPVTFLQQSQQVSCANTASVQTIVASGFRSGTVKSIEMWLTKGSDTSGNTKNPLKWYAPLDVTVTYAGDIYAQFSAGSSQLWNLINSKQTPQVAGTTLGYAGGAYTTTSESYQWVSAPFAQTYDPADSSEYMLNEGIQVQNGIVNIAFRTPSAAADWVLNLSYVYAATAVFSQSTCELVF